MLGFVADARSANFAVAADAGKEVSANSVSHADGSGPWYLPNLVDQKDDQRCKCVDDEDNRMEEHRNALAEAVALTEGRQDPDHDGGDTTYVAVLVARSAALDVNVVIHVGCQTVVGDVMFDELEVACEDGGIFLGGHGS